jgi:lipoprotein-releasing system permease protein
MTRIAVIGVALSAAVMIVSLSVLTGFKMQLKDKISGFNAHLRITNLDSNRSFDLVPVRSDYGFYDSIATLPEVKSLRRYACKGGIIKARDDIQGVVLKGVDADYDRRFFERYLVEGELFDPSDSTLSNMALVSRTLSRLLKLKTGDVFDMYFVQDPVRVRRFTVCGLYDTYFEEMDKTFVLCDIRHVRRLNGWNTSLSSGIEIMLHKIEDTDRAYAKINEIAGFLTFDDGSMLEVSTLRDSVPQIFNWLDILDMNVAIILVVMIFVAGFNMISGLLIMLLEKISTIGILKSMGMTDRSIRLVFVYRSSAIVLRGLFCGNILGLGLCFLQQYFGTVKLNPETYFFSTAPVSVNFLHVALLDVCSFSFIILSQILPSLVVSRISPDRTVGKR